MSRLLETLALFERPGFGDRPDGHLRIAILEFEGRGSEVPTRYLQLELMGANATSKANSQVTIRQKELSEAIRALQRAQERIAECGDTFTEGLSPAEYCERTGLIP